MIIEVLDKVIGGEVIKTFTTAREFKAWYRAEDPNLFADRVVINDQIQYGWDEIEDYLGVMSI